MLFSLEYLGNKDQSHKDDLSLSMSSCWLEVWTFHSACFLTFQGMCVALIAVSSWPWDLGAHILLPGVFTAAAPWNGCKECWLEWDDLLLSGLFLYSISIKKDYKTYNSNTSSTIASSNSNVMIPCECGFCEVLFCFWWKKMLCNSSFFFFLLFFALKFTIFADRLCLLAVGVVQWEQIHRGGCLVLRTWYVRGLTSDCLHSDSQGPDAHEGLEHRRCAPDSVSWFPFTKRESS